MQTTFCFIDGVAQIILQPENAREEQYLSLAVEGRPNVKVKPTTDKSVVLEFVEKQ